MSSDLAAVVMAAGLGTRMRSATPKHFHPVLGRPLVDWVLETARELAPEPLVVVTSPESQGQFDGVEVAVQQEPLGTGDAISAARAALEGRATDVLVLSGDSPLLTPALLKDLVAAHRRSGGAATILAFKPPDAGSYGRIVRDENGSVREIIEAADASPELLDVREVNSSTYVFREASLWPALERLKPVNAQGELYLTDAVRHLIEAGERVSVYNAPDPTEAVGVNTRGELAAAAAALRDRINAEHMEAGVTLVDPSSTWIDRDVTLEQDVTIHPFTILRGRTTVRTGAEVGPHVVAVDAEIGPNALVGPFCYLRPGTVLDSGAKAGTFVEIKNSHLGAGAKVPHQSYIGDAEIGEGTNVGAGAITANYPHEPGRPKQKTTIGRNVRVAVHNSFIAPVEIGDDAWTAAGTVITEDVPPESLAGFPPRQVTKEGYLRGKRDD